MVKVKPALPSAPPPYCFFVACKKRAHNFCDESK